MQRAPTPPDALRKQIEVPDDGGAPASAPVDGTTTEKSENLRANAPKGVKKTGKAVKSYFSDSARKAAEAKDTSGAHAAGLLLNAGIKARGDARRAEGLSGGNQRRQAAHSLSQMAEAIDQLGPEYQALGVRSPFVPLTFKVANRDGNGFTPFDVLRGSTDVAPEVALNNAYETLRNDWKQNISFDDFLRGIDLPEEALMRGAALDRAMQIQGFAGLGDDARRDVVGGQLDFMMALPRSEIDALMADPAVRKRAILAQMDINKPIEDIIYNAQKYGVRNFGQGLTPLLENDRETATKLLRLIDPNLASRLGGGGAGGLNLGGARDWLTEVNPNPYGGFGPAKDWNLPNWQHLGGGIAAGVGTAALAAALLGAGQPQRDNDAYRQALAEYAAQPPM
jgi:hypothetical protein